VSLLVLIYRHIKSLASLTILVNVFVVCVYGFILFIDMYYISSCQLEKPSCVISPIEDSPSTDNLPVVVTDSTTQTETAHHDIARIRRVSSIVNFFLI